MNKYKNTILRRAEIIDEFFHNWLNSNGAKKLVRSLDYKSFQEGLLHDVSNHIMTESLEMPYWDVMLNKTDEMEVIYSNLCNFIRNKYRDKIKYKYKLYSRKTIGRGF